MSFNRLLQPKINPFGLFIYFPKEGAIGLKTFSDKVISLNGLSKYKEKGTYCNSFSDLFISEGKEFWIINNITFSVKRKKTPIDKIEHSMIFLSSLASSSKVFLIGGADKKAFYYDLKKNYFINWAETNEFHIKPSLLKSDDYLYIFDGYNNNNICFERTRLSENEKKWEKIIPYFNDKIISNFPSKSFATALDTNGNVIFLGGDNIILENKYSFVYDTKSNIITLSIKGTNDNMTFDDKTFYKINNKYNIALPRGLNEGKELAAIDKEEQSLIKINIEFPVEGSEMNFQYNSNYNNSVNLCKYCQNSFSGNRIQYNMKYSYYSQYSHPQTKQRNFYDIQIKQEPKEFGYYISGNSSEEAKLKAKRDKIQIVPINKNYESIIKPNQFTSKVIKKQEENLKDNFGVTYLSKGFKSGENRNQQQNFSTKSQQAEQNYIGKNINLIHQDDDDFNVIKLDQSKTIRERYNIDNTKQQNHYQKDNEDMNAYYSNLNKQNISDNINFVKNNKSQISKIQDGQYNQQGQSKKNEQQVNPEKNQNQQVYQNKEDKGLYISQYQFQKYEQQQTEEHYIKSLQSQKNEGQYDEQQYHQGEKQYNGQNQNQEEVQNNDQQKKNGGEVQYFAKKQFQKEHEQNLNGKNDDERKQMVYKDEQSKEAPLQKEIEVQEHYTQQTNNNEQHKENQIEENIYFENGEKNEMLEEKAPQIEQNQIKQIGNELETNIEIKSEENNIRQEILRENEKHVDQNQEFKEEMIIQNENNYEEENQQIEGKEKQNIEIQTQVENQENFENKLNEEKYEQKENVYEVEEKENIVKEENDNHAQQIESGQKEIDNQQSEKLEKEEINQQIKKNINIENDQEQHEIQNGEKLNEKDNLKIHHDLVFNNAYMQNQNDEKHFTEPTHQIFQEETYENERDLNEQQNINLENANIENNNEEIQDDFQENEQNNDIENKEDQHIENNYINENENFLKINTEENAKLIEQNKDEIHKEEDKNVFISDEYNQIGGNEFEGEEQEQIYQIHYDDCELNYKEGEEMPQGDIEEHDLNGKEEAYEGEVEQELNKEGDEIGQEISEEEREGQNIVIENNEENVEYNPNEEEYNEEGNEEGNIEQEMNYEDYNKNNEINGEEIENNELQIEERDSLKKIMTQNVGDDIKQIKEHPNKVYYDKENFCDFKP